MKNIHIKLLSIFLIAVAIVSCEDEDKDPFSDIKDPSVLGSFVTLSQESLVIDFTNPSSTYDFTIDAPSSNVSEYNLSVQRISAGDTTDLAPLTSINTFPGSLSITAGEIADALGQSPDDFLAGDQFDFRAEVVGTDGSTATYENLNGDSTGPGQFQGLFHTTYLSCPFVAADAAGEYTVSFHRFDAFFGPQGETRTVVAGPGPNQITILGGAVILDGADDLVIEVDPGTGIASYGGASGQVHFNTFGPGTYLGVGGFVFSCTGVIDISIQSAGFIDNFLTMSKN